MRPGRSALIKVGGSLFSLDDLSGRLQSLMLATGADDVLVVPGGGRMVDAVRDWGQIHSLGADASHRLAIETLGLTARFLTSILPGSCLTSSETAAKSHQRVRILDVPAVISELEGRGVTPLPASWDVTGDSIAAWIAVHWNVDMLVLAKSTQAPDSIPEVTSTPADAAESEGGVDRWFEHLVADLPLLFWCNLRRDPSELSAFEKSLDRTRLVLKQVLPAK